MKHLHCASLIEKQRILQLNGTPNLLGARDQFYGERFFRRQEEAWFCGAACIVAYMDGALLVCEADFWSAAAQCLSIAWDWRPGSQHFGGHCSFLLYYARTEKTSLSSSYQKCVKQFWIYEYASNPTARLPRHNVLTWKPTEASREMKSRIFV